MLKHHRNNNCREWLSPLGLRKQMEVGVVSRTQSLDGVPDKVRLCKRGTAQMEVILQETGWRDKQCCWFCKQGTKLEPTIPGIHPSCLGEVLIFQVMQMEKFFCSYIQGLVHIIKSHYTLTFVFCLTQNEFLDKINIIKNVKCFLTLVFERGTNHWINAYRNFTALCIK